MSAGQRGRSVEREGDPESAVNVAHGLTASRGRRSGWLP
jgi:hypothetical protein